MPLTAVSGVRNSCETDRLIRLVNDLLLLSRADSEALNLRREPVDLKALAEATADWMASRAEAHDLVLQVEASPDAPQVWADADLRGQS